MASGKQAKLVLRNVVSGEVPLGSRRLSPMVQRAVEHLNALPLGEFLTSTQLAHRLELNTTSLAKDLSLPPLSEMRMQQGSRFIYFSKTTAEQLRKDGEL